ncbi:hypothetical protein KC19_7G154200 [Ceratodon purpureus]|uniref:Uncharacterized protein n=1 Tax=Ceratodon purpureus TaxID=3225 RepID=A0A8T0HF71_CERPU|nr:hypothetical protein KC19_7G154200 [Ceratodon purpureus]
MTPGNFVKLCQCNYGGFASSRMFSTFLREYQGLLRHRYRALASFLASQFSTSQLPRKKKLLPAPKAVGTSSSSRTCRPLIRSLLTRRMLLLPPLSSIPFPCNLFSRTKKLCNR